MMVCSSAARLRGDRAPPLDRASACCSTAAPAAATCSRARPRTRSSPSAGSTTEKAPTPATAPSSPTASTSRALLVLFLWEVVLEWTAAARQKRRDVRPRGHRGGIYPFMRGGDVRVRPRPDRLRVLTDMMRGRPAVYATFASYDEVAHHSGLERADTLEALRKLDQQFAPDRARPPVRAAAVRDRRALRPRPDAGRDVQAAQRLRARRARRALARPRATSPPSRAATSSTRSSATPSTRRPGKDEPRAPRTTSPAATSSCSARATSGSST